MSGMGFREARGWTILGLVAAAGAAVGVGFVVFGVVVIVLLLVWG